MPDNLNYGVKLEIGRGRGAEAAQGVIVVADTTPLEIIAGQSEKTLYLNYLELSWSDTGNNSFVYFSDGERGFVWWIVQLSGSASYQPRAYSLNFGEYGFALTEGNGLWGRTSTANSDFTVVALGCFR